MNENFELAWTRYKWSDHDGRHAIRDGTALETIETIECIREALSKSNKLLPALVPDLDDAVRRLREEAGQGVPELWTGFIEARALPEALNLWSGQG